ncbi:MAG: hypothetical protein A4E66_00767 [Syntrophus sp. PtaB.Bin001]|nr:MAG: hypothetical protein A4E66_00767 [Syntrophus sp. PtaB.Bin001]
MLPYGLSGRSRMRARGSRPVLGGAWGESPTVYSTIYSNGQVILLYCGKHGLGKQDSPFLAKVQHHGQFMLCR